MFIPISSINRSDDRDLAVIRVSAVHYVTKDSLYGDHGVELWPEFGLYLFAGKV